MSALSIITARGGSRRIPRKNIRDFNKKPIIAYSIEAAVKSGVFDEVMVSTDDEEIADIAASFGAKIPFLRSAENSDDRATTADAAVEVVGEYKKRGTDFDDLCVIYPTAPFVTGGLLKRAFDGFKLSGADALIPVVVFSYPPQRAFVIKDEGGRIAYERPEYERARSQDLKKLYHDAGQFYFIKTEVLLDKRTMVPENTASIVLDEMMVQDIDNETDWRLAELKYELLSREGALS